MVVRIGNYFVRVNLCTFGKYFCKLFMLEPVLSKSKENISLVYVIKEKCAVSSLRSHS